MPSRPLPPLNALRALEAYARTGSMTKAAEDLSVTHSAISHHIKNLEERLGRKLLVRNRNDISLTQDGIDLARDLSVAFEIIKNAVSKIDGEIALVVSSPATFANKWLIPRLGDFRFQYPDITIRVVEDNIRSESARQGEVDVSIKLSRSKSAHEEQMTPFLTNSFGPVLSSELYIQNSLDQESALNLPRLVASTYPDAWAEWAKSRDMPLPKRFTRQILHNNTQLIAAVIAGQGIAVTAHAYVKDAISEGRLVAPWGFELRESAFTFSKSENLRRSIVGLFCNWLLSQGDIHP